MSGASVPLPANPVLLTIDDGTLNSYVGVTALLAKYGFNMVTFIVTQFADGATANLEPYVGWNASWDQLLALPSAQWSFAFHAGAHGHNITFPNNAACQYYYPCQLPTETVSDYRSRVAEEITTGRQTAAKMLGTRMNDKMWAVPWGDLGIQPDLPAEGDAKTWLAPWAAPSSRSSSFRTRSITGIFTSVTAWWFRAPGRRRYLKSASRATSDTDSLTSGRPWAF